MTGRFFPAEWHEQQCIQLTWPHAGTDWKYCLDEITETFLQLAEVITHYERLIVVAPDIELPRQQLRQRLSDKAFSQISFCECPTDDTWARDHGALTLLGRSGKPADTILMDFKFNGWGEKFPAAHDNAINRHLTEAGILTATMEDHNDFVLEGGSVESDGEGTVFTTSNCLLAPRRNQPLDKEDIESQLKTRLCAKRVVWLDHGQLLGDDTDGHIDTIVRCAPRNTLIYVSCDDANDEQHTDFEALKLQLQELRNNEGHPYRLIAVPMPDAIYEDGYRLPATYANFVIINGAVIVPTYGQPEKDTQALEAIRRAFPEREAIGIDARTVIRQHGSLHCLTMQYF